MILHCTPCCGPKCCSCFLFAVVFLFTIRINPTLKFCLGFVLKSVPFSKLFDTLFSLQRSRKLLKLQNRLCYTVPVYTTCILYLYTVPVYLCGPKYYLFFFTFELWYHLTTLDLAPSHNFGTSWIWYQLGQLWYQGVNFLVPGGKLFGTKFAVVWYQPGQLWYQGVA